MLAVAAGGHALCHIATLVLQQVVIEAARDLGIASIGWVVALGPFLMGFCAPGAGWLGDRFGTRRIYGGYLALLALASGAAAFAPGAWLFVPAAALIGVAASFHHPVGLAWIGEALPTQRARAIGIHGFIGHFGSTLAPTLVLLLAQSVGWRHTYRVVGLAAALLLALLWCTTRTAGEVEYAATRRERRSSRIPWRLAFAPALLIVMVAMIGNGLVHQGFWASWSSFVRAQAGVLPDAPPSASGASLQPLLLRLSDLLPAAWRVGEGGPASFARLAGPVATFVLAFGSVGELFGARVARRGGGLRRYALMNVISAVGLLGVAFLSGPLLLVAGALFAFFHFGTQPLENELIARRADPQVRGLAYGMKFVVSFGIGSLATDPAIAGWQSHGFPPVFIALAGLALGGALLCLLLARSKRSPLAH